MYVLYEHHKGPSGEILITDMALSFRFPGNPKINFKALSQQQRALFEIVKEQFFKDIHPKFRSMDDKTKVWSFFSPHGEILYRNLKDSPLTSVGLEFKRVEGLQTSVENGWISEPKARFDPGDFFYNPEPASPTGAGSITKDQAALHLSVLLELPKDSLISTDRDKDLIKKAYRRKALAFHPDRNSGDGSRMSELNMLWQVYNG